MTARNPIARGIGYPIDAPSRSNSTYTYTCTTPSPTPAPHQHQHLSSAQRAREVVTTRCDLSLVRARGEEDFIDVGPMVRVHDSSTVALEATDRARSISEELAEALDGLTARKRWDVTRTGVREPIEFPLRLAVGRRDNFTCQRCHGYTAAQFELDHIIPWSAGGPDEATNLRVLCAPCNQERSNYDEPAQAKAPVTWWCVQCWSEPPPYPRQRMSSGHDLNLDRFVERPIVVAYCAYCRLMSRTDMTLRKAAIENAKPLPTKENA